MRGHGPAHTIRSRPLVVDQHGASAGVQDLADPPRLDLDAFERGLYARRHAHKALLDVGDVLDLVEDIADELINQTLALLNAVDVPSTA